ncbi:magnesium transporter CorA family protein [Acinetobacter larvae]|uniref:Magnesium transporter n=1 Tax=Acinetobacter larvae TaxID=1789224 RepID=A0A1B2M2Z4_9GAMM|nr:magnesium transporter CorA family protein [Acinetobacter larvae]AOA59570.1 hypothetical protein BFG52_15270 [Acinetobacter larvae]
MIHIYRHDRSQHNSLAWYRSITPTRQHTQNLIADYNIPASFISAAIDPDERPRIEQQGECVLLILHIPYTDPDVMQHADAVKYRTVPFSMILTADHFITLCKKDAALGPDFFTHSSLLHNQPQPAQVAMTVIANTAEHFVQAIQNIEQAIQQAEAELVQSYRNQELYALLYLNESLLYINSSLKQLIQVLSKAELQHAILHSDYDHALYRQSLIEFEQVAAVAKINQLNLNNVMDAYGNIIQNNVSHVVKLLTAITIVLSIPTLIASIYGMNVPLPFQEAEYAFNYLVIAMCLCSALVAYYFYKKRYF